MKVKGHVLHVRKKLKEIMENEENGGLIDKKAFEDELESLVGAVLELSLYSLSLSLLDT